LDVLTTEIDESGLKRKTLLLALLVFSAGVLSVLISTTPLVRAQGGGSVEGHVYWTDMYGNLRPMEWAYVTASDGASTYQTSTVGDGSYVMWLPAGTYNITASSGNPAFYPESAPSVVVSWGSSTPVDFTLKPTGKPVPELLPWAQPIILLGMLMITAVAVRRYKTRTRN
jgi:hypothetical protein